MNDLLTPQDVGVPHATWRHEQYDLWQKVEGAESGARIFGQVPTGGGKTTIACAMGAQEQVLYVAGTLGLLDQASREYGFAVIKGRQEYPCVHEAKVEKWKAKGEGPPTARDCHYEKVRECWYYNECPYQQAKQRAFASSRMGCTYKYLALSKKAQARGGSLVLDECHDACDQLLDFASFEMTEDRRRWWNLPDFPYSRRYGPSGKGDVMDPAARVNVVNWLKECLRHIPRDLLEDESRTGSSARGLKNRFEKAVEEMGDPELDWFLECGPGIMERRKKVGGRWRTVQMAGIRVRPLDAGPIAAPLMEGKEKVLLMSATIGADAGALATALGIDRHKFYTYEHPIPEDARPVFDLGVERLTKTNLDRNPALLTVQAMAIRRFVDLWPPDWRGVVLTSSYYKINILRAALGGMLGDRVFVPPQDGVSERIGAFVEDPRSGLIAVDTIQGWGHGLDLRGSAARIAVVAGVPFENPYDPFVRARRSRPAGDKFYWWKAYMAVVQACGRVSRGEKIGDEGLGTNGLGPDDFTNHGWLVNVAAIADGSAVSPRAKRTFPDWFEIKKQ